MDFVSRLPVTSRKKDSVRVIVDKLTKLAHFIPIIARELSKGKLHKALGTELNFNTAYHPQTDGILEDMLRCCNLEFEGSWEKYFLLAEFMYNNSYQFSIKMALFEALYERKCRTPLYKSKLHESKLFGTDLIREIEDKDCLKATSDRQKSYADLKRKDTEFFVGDRVFLKVSPWQKVLRFGRKGKLSPRFIRPYEIIERIGSIAYRLALPPELEKIHIFFLFQC
ncbi:Retrotransposon protein, Ty3-gypsy subclass [Gossypium australe]|uniref:Retrotransposon protein, Ty3-gypsy subclass n=1 Tax=Gossypium australe TaxID=47621 RepID=A0A5B6VYF5_9ROSI|nr:Retrotransposon protein, Ty3-gypsy subclass [Gossypium australe]